MSGLLQVALSRVQATGCPPQPPEELTYLGSYTQKEGFQYNKGSDIVYFKVDSFIDAASDRVLDTLCHQLDNPHDIKLFRSLFITLQHLLLARQNDHNKALHLYATHFNPVLTHESWTPLNRFGGESISMPEADFWFLSKLCHLMDQARFAPMTQRELDISEAMSSTPGEVNWDILDSSLMKNFFDRHLLLHHNLPSIPDFANHCLIFWHGFGLQTYTGFFFSQKVDALLMVLLGPLGRLLGFFPSQKPNSLACSSELAPTLPHGDPDLRASQDVTTIFEPQKVEQRRLLFERKPSFASFFRRDTIKEPAFEEVVVVYRQKHEKNNTEMDGVHNNPNGILVHRFSGVPVRDFCTSVLPLRRPALWNWADLLYFLMVFSWLVTLLFKLKHTWAASTYWDEVILSVFILFVPMLIRHINHRIFLNRARHQFNTIRHRLLRKSLDCNRTALAYIRDCAIQQDLNAIALAYFVMWQSSLGGRNLDSIEVDRVCEQLLETLLGLRVDFDVEKSLSLLREYEVFHTDENEHCHVETIEKTISHLQGKLLEFLEGEERDIDRVSPPPVCKSK